MLRLRRMAAAVVAAGAIAVSLTVPASTDGAGPATPVFSGTATGMAIGQSGGGAATNQDPRIVASAYQNASYKASTYGYAAGQCSATGSPKIIAATYDGLQSIEAYVRCTGDPGPGTRPLERFLGYKSDHLSSTTGSPNISYKREGELGRLHNTQQPGTVPLYMCQSGNDTFTSIQPNCEGRDYVTRLGYIDDTQPGMVLTRPLRRCMVTATGEHFDSNDLNCEGQTAEGILGYTIA
ncbi:hypothetical protein [Streptomyces sp. NPDC059564]|uniref:hypothetical protein n=1 Tax=Streptomyces sp. NPDC059564 TaxID=3346865 RepID=UPI0036ADF91E